MVIKKIKISLDKKDYFRALLSDTLPFDTPIIFSNDGLYLNVKKLETKRHLLSDPVFEIYKKIINPLKEEPANTSKKQKQSSPYKYKIIKDSYNFRSLSLIHPRAQINYCEFYQNFSSVIIHNIAKSNFSIRKPIKVSSSFYIDCNKKNKEKGKYKKSAITNINTELKQKYSSSYFSYFGFNRLYKYYNSTSFYEHEKKFPIMWNLDVSHCFDSIYSHSIAWAIKDKEYVRSHLEFSSQFTQEIDTLMQRSNNNETNGIPIGSEFSRIFAELIFQKIDVDIENELKNNFNWNHNIDYKILRYVDDYILYAHNEQQALEITKFISLKLNNYNLHLNNQKLIKLERPFCTKKTSIISRVDELLKSFKQKILIEKNDIIQILDIEKSHSTYKDFINKTKSICFENNSNYGDISSYIISSLCLLAEKIIEYFDIERINASIDELLLLKIKNSLFLISDLMVFYYSVYPYISSSYKMAKAIILMDEYFNFLSHDYQNILRTKISHAAENLYVSMPKTEKSNLENVPIEKLNFILSTTFFGDNYLIGVDAFKEILNDKELDYFTIISCLFYFRGRSYFQEMKMLLEKKIKSKLTKDLDLLQNSQQAHLFLDILSCPFVTQKTRREIYLAFMKKYYPNINKNHIDINNDLLHFQEIFWFVDWRSHNLLSMIEKKELKVTY